MNVLSLFSGIGGIDLGLQRAGMTIAGQVEIDPWCRTILAKHWPEVPRHDDVRTAAAWWGDRAIDLVAGGFPCQPVSLAGKGLAQADSRWLWPATRDVIRDLRPQWVLLENVPGLLGRGMGDVLADLAAIGYDAEWDCVPAAFVGAPHIRNRVWIVAYPQGGGQRHPRRHHGLGPEGLEPREPQPGHVADAADSGRHDPRLDRGRATPSDDTRTTLASESRRGCSALADAAGARLPSGPSGTSGTVWHDARRPQPERPGWWPAEPDVGRVAHGIPRRVDRLRGLGNAVVPQVAEHIGRLIMTAAAA